MSTCSPPTSKSCLPAPGKHRSEKENTPPHSAKRSRTAETSFEIPAQLSSGLPNPPHQDDTEIPTVPFENPVADNHQDDTAIPTVPFENPVADNHLVVVTRKDPVTVSENYHLRQQVIELEEKLKETRPRRFSVNEIRNYPKKIRFYTGFPDYDHLKIFIELFEDEPINYRWFRVSRIPREDQILMTLMRLRLNLCLLDLGDRFGCCATTASNIVITWIFAIHQFIFVDLMGEIPSRAKNLACLPSAFASFLNCRIVLDCTEVAVEVSSSFRIQKKTYSSYKHLNTFKGLIGIAPNGVATYGSNLYPGSISDKEITRHCGVLDQLEPGDMVIADKGFLISDIVPRGVYVNVPPFLETAQFTPAQVLRTLLIARARVHVEREIRRVKCYKILQKIPHDLYSYASEIWQVCVALTNFRLPLLREMREKYDRIYADFISTSSDEEL